jgi:hypothetical protein
LQSNHVVLQRRQDAPKSWLNKQRQMVNGKLPGSASPSQADIGCFQLHLEDRGSMGSFILA